MYSGPSRGGVRGGRDQFSWDKVKNDKHRENYLGHSIHAPVGKWQEGKDLLWYTKDRAGQQDALGKEKAEIQKRERDKMNEYLGLKKPSSKKRSSEVNREQLKEVLKREEYEDEDRAERVSGLGYEPAATHQSVIEVLGKDQIPHKSNLLPEEIKALESKGIAQKLKGTTTSHRYEESYYYSSRHRRSRSPRRHHRRNRSRSRS
jgi:hypothetical protein